MKDRNDIKTSEIFPENPKLLKGVYAPFQRLHIELNGKKTTTSVDTILYDFLSIKLGVIPHTRKANKAIKNWIYKRIKQEKWSRGETTFKKLNFNRWLKEQLILAIADEKLKQAYFNR
jgi:hypothetical protein